MDKEIIDTINQLQCRVSEEIYWDGFFKGFTLSLIIWGIVLLISYMMKNDDARTRRNEKREPWM